MKTLYEISSDLENIFNEIEENEGEITDELNEKLKIKEDELVEKLENYHKAIRTWQNNEQFCKSEKQRLNSLQNIYKNRIERLKDRMLTAVISYGQDGKTGNKFISLPDSKMYTRTSHSVSIDELRLSQLCRYILEYVHYLVAEAGFNESTYLSSTELLDGLNEFAFTKSKRPLEEESKPFTMDDLTQIKVTFDFNLPNLVSLFVDGNQQIFGIRQLLNFYLLSCEKGKLPIIAHITPNMETPDWKLAINGTNPNGNGGGISVAKIITSTNLCIN